MNVIINESKLQKAIEWFAKFVVYFQKGGAVDFYDGFMQSQEGYKREIYINAHSNLKLDTWSVDKIGTGYIEGCVVAGFNSKDNHGFNNIVVYQNITKFHNRAVEDLNLSEDILYHMYLDEEPGEAFDKALKFWGKWYPEFSYLMFIRDCESYLPVKTKHHSEKFAKLDIPTDCFDICSWENYMYFIDVHKYIRNELCNSFDKKISLLDAHSFVWQLYAAPDDFLFEMEDKLATIKGGLEFVEKVVENNDYTNIAKEQIVDIDESESLEIIAGEEKEVFIKHRINQGIFRRRLINRYKKCCICGVSDQNLLVASHIQPWSKCEKVDKLVVDNGLLLCPNHDCLFDRGLITFDDEGAIIISDDLQQVDRVYMNINENMKIIVTDKMKKYLHFHRENEFESWKKR